MGSAVGFHDASVAGSARVLYDAAGRDVSKYTFSPNSPTTVRTAMKVWDASGATGLLSSVTDPLGQTTSYVYDPAGRIFGSGATHVAGVAAFDDAYAKHKVSRDAIRIAGEPRPMAPPVFLKPLEDRRRLYSGSLDEKAGRGSRAPAFLRFEDHHVQ